MTPLQMAAFYAMLANGGNMVTPYLVSDVEQPRREGVAARRLRRFTSPPPKPSGVDPAALAPVRDGLFRATHGADRHFVGRLRELPGPDLGQDGNREKVVPLPGYPATTSRISPGGAAGALGRARSIVVCALIENGGHGSTAAAPAA